MTKRKIILAMLSIILLFFLFAFSEKRRNGLKEVLMVSHLTLGIQMEEK